MFTITLTLKCHYFAHNTTINFSAPVFLHLSLLFKRLLEVQQSHKILLHCYCELKSVNEIFAGGSTGGIKMWSQTQMGHINDEKYIQD